MINLLPPEYKKSGLLDLPKEWLLAGGVAIVLVILLVIFSYTSLLVDYKISRQKLDIAEKKLTGLESNLRIIKSYKQKKNQKLKELNDKKEILGTKLELAPVLSSLQEIVSEDSWIISFDFKNKQDFEFIGYALNNQGIGELFNELKAAPNFTDVSIDLVKQRALNEKEYKREKIVYYKVTGSLVNQRGGNDEKLE